MRKAIHGLINEACDEFMAEARAQYTRENPPSEDPIHRAFCRQEGEEVLPVLQKITWLHGRGATRSLYEDARRSNLDNKGLEIVYLPTAPNNNQRG